MKELTCIVLGGGYAGIHAVKEIQDTIRDKTEGIRLRLVLIDKHPYHTRKVLLFKPAAKDQDITIPLLKLFPSGVEIVQGQVTRIESGEKRLLLQDTAGNENSMKYDILVVAAGSTVRQIEPNQGGVALTGLEAARKIHQIWRSNLMKTTQIRDASERARLMTIAVAGAGISGIETAAELAYFVREDAKRLGLNPDLVNIYLCNHNKRLFQEGPVKVGLKLERSLRALGVTVCHESKVLHEQKGVLTLSTGRTLPVGLCVWTLGLLPNPMLAKMGLRVNSEGYVLVDTSYRVEGAPGVYSIGDCAHIVDSASGRVDGNTCKEAGAQAARLGRIVAADLAGRPAPSHKSFMDFFCFGLGPEQGMAWTRQWGVDFVFTGKLGLGIRKYTWDLASLLK
ncbi:NAD(P)/FAD-dependent oxidoreductase [Paenibacillus dakarensis]|uniref:NAD(P)/FAD-dependent oxidoreductase n=1 Tax=Paenibacillus dakarensis TaxID=1527293 RepID=UPI0006D57EF9|nr:FAD-dependent oxidoreductase [Paenibacillus dakarensis]